MRHFDVFRRLLVLLAWITFSAVLCFGGTFQKPLDFATGEGPQGMAVGDFNNDGHPDLRRAI